MIVGFAKHSTGGGSGPVDYVTRATNPDGTARTPAPVVVRGNPADVRHVIDALPFRHTYTSGVLSFAPGENITPDQEAKMMTAFEKTAFAGLDSDRYSILWVRHQHAGHHELHFVTPRVDLATGKSLNIAPPGKASRELFDTFRSMVNAEHGLADPDDPMRARDVSLPNHLAKLQADASRKGQALKEDIRETITEYVRREVDAGRVKDRAGVVRYLEAQGYELPRTGKDYLTVRDPATGERWRLKGGLYRVENWNPQDGSAPRIRYGVPDPERAAALAAKLEPMTAARARFHHKRYKVPEDRETPDHAANHRMESLRGYMARHLGGEALREVWEPRRRRARAARQGEEQQRGEHDGHGTTLTRRLAAVGEGVRGAGARFNAALGRFDAAHHRLERSGGAVAARAPATDPWEFMTQEFYKRHDRGFYGRNHGMEP
jgi:hypothetical protein